MTAAGQMLTEAGQQEVLVDVVHGLIEIDNLDAARRLAEMASGTVKGDIEALLAEGLARRGELDAAHATAAAMENYSAQADAFRRIAERASQQRDQKTAQASLEKALRAAQDIERVAAPRALLNIAISAQHSGFADIADSCVRNAVRQILDDNAVDHNTDVLTLAAELQAMRGRLSEALDIAKLINHAWFGPRCRYIVGLRVGSRGGEAEFHSATDQIENEWWKAASAATIVLYERDNGGSRDTADVDRLVSRIPKSDARSRLYELICKAAIRTKQFDIALSSVEALREDSEIRLVRLGHDLQGIGRAKGLLPFMASFAASACTSLFGGVMLARAFPSTADAIARVILNYEPSTTELARPGVDVQMPERGTWMAATPEESPASEGSVEPGRLMSLLMQFSAMPSLGGAQRLVERHPELLSPAAEVGMEMLVMSARQTGHSETVDQVIKAQQLLDRCRTIGVQPAFSEARSPADAGTDDEEYDYSEEKLRLAAAIMEFVTAPTLEASKRVLMQHDELLSDIADRAFDVIIAGAEPAGDAAAEMLRKHQNLLRQCRAVGVDRAFQEHRRD